MRGVHLPARRRSASPVRRPARVKRAANAERDIPTARPATRASSCGPDRDGRATMARPICWSRSAPSHPVCAAGSRAIHERIAWMTRMSARRVITVSPPGLSSRASAAMKRSVLCIHSALRCVPRIDADHPRQQADEVLRRRVIEAHDTADHRRRGPAASVPQDLVAVADELARRDRRVSPPARRRALEQPMARRHAGTSASSPGRSRRRVAPSTSSQHWPDGDDVKHQAVRERRQLEAPRRGELRPAVEDAAHAQEVQRFAERVHRLPRISHAVQYVRDTVVASTCVDDRAMR